MGIGKRLNDLMTERNTNANELANRIGVNPSTIYSIIKRDGTKIDIDILLKICEALNISAEYFYHTYKTNEATSFLRPDEIELISVYNQLNTEGQKTALNILNGLAIGGEYKKSTSHEMDKMQA